MRIRIIKDNVTHPLGGKPLPRGTEMEVLPVLGNKWIKEGIAKEVIVVSFDELFKQAATPNNFVQQNNKEEE
jgi:uncharacterized protein (DUF433 family)